MTQSSFGDRFAYSLWLYHLVNGRPIGFAAIGKAVGRTGEAVAAWPTAKDAPNIEVHEAVAQLLAVGERWLFKGAGEPPRPHLWTEWLAARATTATGAEIPAQPQPKKERPRLQGRRHVSAQKKDERKTG